MQLGNSVRINTLTNRIVLLPVTNDLFFVEKDGSVRYQWNYLYESYSSGCCVLLSGTNSCENEDDVEYAVSWFFSV
jgi:hypothetical protein